MTTNLTHVPSLAIFPNEGGNVVKINFYNGSVEIEQDNNLISIGDDEIEEFIKALRRGRKKANEMLSRM